MANHLGRMQAKQPEQPEPPIVKWVAMVRIGDEWAFAEMTTQGNRIIEQRLGKPNPWRVEVECQVQNWVMDNVVNREMNP